MRVLIVEDEFRLAEALKQIMAEQKYLADTVHDGVTGLEYGLSGQYDIMILDVMLPGMDGYQVLKTVRKAGSIPVIMVTARGETFDKVLCLELGADDYIVKPFDGKEMAARVRAVLRRTQGAEEETGGTLAWPGLTVSIAEYEARYEGKPLDMPPKELEVLYFLASHPNQVFTREQLLQQVWGFDFFGDSRTVDVHIKRVREKLPDSAAHGWSIETVRGVGYKFAVKR